MTERERACVATTVGAIAGAIASYLLFTQRGSELRRQMVPAFENLERELNHFKQTMATTGRMASQGWSFLNDVIGDTGTTSPRRATSDPHQHVPF